MSFCIENPLVPNTQICGQENLAHLISIWCLTMMEQTSHHGGTSVSSRWDACLTMVGRLQHVSYTHVFLQDDIFVLRCERVKIITDSKNFYWQVQ